MRKIIFGVMALVLVGGSMGDLAAQPKEEEKKEKNKDKETLVNGRTLKEWIADISERDPGVRLIAMQTVAMYGRAAVEAGACEPLIKQLNDRDASIRVNATMTFGRIGVDADHLSETMSSLGRLLNDNQQIVRFRAASTIGLFGPIAKAAIPQLVNVAKDVRNSFEVRKAAAWALGTTGFDPENNNPDMRCIKALNEMLSDHSALVRFEALTSLYLLGPPRQKVDRRATIQQCYYKLSDKDKTVVIWSHMVIMHFEQAYALKHLEGISRQLQNPDVAVRIQAIQALAVLGEKAKSQVPEIVRRLRDKNLVVVLWALAALEKIGPAAQEALPAIQEMVKSANDSIRTKAQDAVVAINEKPIKGKKMDALNELKRKPLDERKAAP